MPVADGDNVCIALNLKFSKDMFPLLTGYCCCFYTKDTLFNTNTTLCLDICRNSYNATYPCFWEPEDNNCTNWDSKKDRFPFDYRNEKAVNVLRQKGFKDGTKGIDNWFQCAKAAVNCCDNMEEKDINPGDGYCPANWDSWTCLDPSPHQTTQQKPCPSYIYPGELPSCQRYSNKMCLETGKWNVSALDYKNCSPNPMLRDRILYHVILLSVSIAMALPALIIFFSYRNLRKTRVILHRNLITAIVIRNIFTIVVKTVITLDALTDSEDYINVMNENPEWCRMFSFMEKLSSSAVFSCFLLEGIFLHRLIAAAFKGEPKMLFYYLGAAGLAVLPVAVWTVITAIYNDVYCWTVDGDTNYMYIIDGPRIFTLAVNFLLMADIVRVLCTKLRSVNTVKSNQTRRMIRATILLIPLFGVQFLVTLVRPKTDDCDMEQVYYYIFYTMDGLQGALVALLYCYLNREVHVQLQRTFTLLQIRFHQMIGREYKPQHRPTWVYSENPRTTTSVVATDEVPRKGASLPSENLPAKSDRPLVGSMSDSG